MAQIPVALQMYTLRNEAAQDFTGTLRQVAAMGYAGVELVSTGGMEAAALKALLGELNLRPAAAHVALATLENDLQGTIDYHLELGNSYIVCPWLPEERRRSEADYRALADVLNRIGAACRAHDLQLCYHNHDFELQTFGGRTALDLLYESTDPDLVQAEIDVYWVRKGGGDPMATIRRLAGRCPLLHLKDMADDAERSFAEVGTGIMPFDAIFVAAQAAGTSWYIVEQDVCQRPPIESARISLENLRARGIA